MFETCKTVVLDRCSAIGPDLPRISDMGWKQDGSGREGVQSATCKAREIFRTIKQYRIWLVVSTHLKNIGQIGNLPQIGVKIENL